MSREREECRPGRACFRLIREGIEAQRTGLIDLERGRTQAGTEHILWGLQKVIEGLLCVEKR